MTVTGKEIRIVSLLVLDTVFFLLEAIVGYTVGSLALVADSFHMLNDIISLFIALWAVKVKTSKPADGKYTYGWQRAEIIGALINAVFLLALCFTIVIEAIQRFFIAPEVSNPKLILIVATAGLLSNGVGLVLFHEHGHSHGHSHGPSHSHGDEHSHRTDDETQINSESYMLKNGCSHRISQYMPINVVGRIDESSNLLPKNNQAKTKAKSMNTESMFLHVLGDALGNIGVIITALFIWKTDYTWRFYSDPVISLVITMIIFSSALPLCRKSSKILLQATPHYLDLNRIVEEIVLIPSIKSVHDFHVWNLDEDFLVASLHLEMNETSHISVVESDANAGQINKCAFIETVAQVRLILHNYKINSVTIQPEFLAKEYAACEELT
ncbi:hypothetical protein METBISCDRAFT_22446 [Metschnikowia bicuspidata]|uniref:Cation efflux protein transmembrane domain-containing protein n=1 Tax=Metschnikowia bicuspidata TaxID=27322 RepID=A0A4P9ZG97_9ASCO|nr:hypothetical protein METBISCDRAFT_22446 [Metschnikowia bicuspidata]